jgi:sterol desaturase/sphingolipid hydroxylase (fatty acid hydroxylase superfamily)
MSNLLDSSVISEYWKYYMIDNSSEFFTYNIFPFLCHQFYFYLFNFPYILFFIFKFKFVEKYYIHRVMEYNFKQKKTMSSQEYWHIAKCVVATHFLVVLPFSLTGHDTYLQTGAMSRELPLPNLFTIIWQLFIFMIVQDTVFYWIHRLVNFCSSKLTVPHKIFVQIFSFRPS